MAAERKTERRNMRPAGPLDWLKDPDRSFSITWLRIQFLLAAQELEPAMKMGMRELHKLFMKNTQLKGHALKASRLEFWSALSAWATRFNLAADKWCRTWLLRQLVDASIMGPEVLGGSYEIDDGRPPVKPPPVPDLTWNPLEVSRKTIERRLKRYLDEVENAWRLAGYAPSHERREPAHLWWLAGYQVCGWSKNGIAEAAGVDRSGVIRALEKLAKEIGLTLRPTDDNDRGWTAEKIRSALAPPL
jgi:hypothetical protein